MLDYGALPPEINSGRMYLGPGSGPMLAAASAWEALADELSLTATGYGSVVGELAAQHWLGPASLAMAGAAAAHLAWLHRTAEQAAQTATQARAAAAAYEWAFAMTVPPPVVAANRTLLFALIATNFFGQNSAAIAATELHYAEMWGQDATAMYGYAGSSAAATRLAPFSAASPTSNPVGVIAGSGATLQQLAAPTAPLSPAMLLAVIEHVPNVTNSVLSTSNAVASGRGIYAVNERLAFQETQDAEESVGLGLRFMSATPAGSPIPAASAGMGRAVLVGKLSVPPNWAVATTAAQSPTATAPLTGTGAITAAAVDAPVTPDSVFSQSVLGTLSRHGPDTPRPKSKPIIVRTPAAG